MRLTTVSFDYGGPDNDFTNPAARRIDGGYGNTETDTLDLVAGRTGQAVRHISAAPRTGHPLRLAWQFLRSDLSTATIARAYVNIPELPNVEVSFLQLGPLRMFVAPDGRLVMKRDDEFIDDPADSGTSVVGGHVTRGTLTAGTWHRLEVAVVGTFATDEDGNPIPAVRPLRMLAVRLDGVIVGRRCPQQMNTDPPTQLSLGWGPSYGGDVDTGLAILFDDVAVNDDIGDDQNTWPGPGRVYHSLPTWTTGASGGMWRGSGYSALPAIPTEGNCDGTAFPGQNPGFHYCGKPDNDDLIIHGVPQLHQGILNIPPQPVSDAEAHDALTDSPGSVVGVSEKPNGGAAFDLSTLIAWTGFGMDRQFVRGALVAWCNTFFDDDPPVASPGEPEYGNKACRNEYRRAADPGGGFAFRYGGTGDPSSPAMLEQSYGDIGMTAVAVAYPWMYHSGDPDFAMNGLLNADGAFGAGTPVYQPDLADVPECDVAYTNDVGVGPIYDATPVDNVYAVPFVIDDGFVAQPPLPSCSRTLLTWT